MVKPTLEGLRNRIKADLDFYSGAMPERNAIAWSAYLSALFEWQFLSVNTFDELNDMLPFIEENPVIVLMLGRFDDNGEE